jgi:hypothetical protein
MHWHDIYFERKMNAKDTSPKIILKKVWTKSYQNIDKTTKIFLKLGNLS